MQSIQREILRAAQDLLSTGGQDPRVRLTCSEANPPHLVQHGREDAGGEGRRQQLQLQRLVEFLRRQLQRRKRPHRALQRILCTASMSNCNGPHWALWQAHAASLMGVGCPRWALRLATGLLVTKRAVCRAVEGAAFRCLLAANSARDLQQALRPVLAGCHAVISFFETRGAQVAVASPAGCYAGLEALAIFWLRHVRTLRQSWHRFGTAFQ